MDLEVPIEILDAPRATGSVPRPLDQTLFTLDTDAYDGTVTYSLEVIASNNTTTDFAVDLIENRTPSVTRATARIVPTGTTNVRQRFRTAFVPIAGLHTYKLILGNQAGDQGKLYAARILVGQRGATKTKIFIPLVQFHFTNSSSKVDQTNSTTFVQTQASVYSVWRKNSAAYSALVPSTPWTLEVALENSAPDGVAYASLFTTADRQVTGSELSLTGGVPSVVTASFSDAEAEFTDGTDFELRIQSSAPANTASLLRAGLWVQLRDLTRAEVYYRVLPARYVAGDSWTTGSSRIMLDTSLFRSPRISFEAVLSRDAADIDPLSCDMLDSGTTDEGDTGTDVTESRPSSCVTRRT